MKATFIYNKILLLEFDGGAEGEDNREVCMTMVRMGAFWESADARVLGKRFDWDTLIESLSDENGNLDIFEYDGIKQNFFQYMDGFNVSKKDADRFIETFKGHYTSRERKIIPHIKALPKCGVIIGLVQNGWITTRKHEFAHAFAYVYPTYKAQVSAVIASMPEDLKERFWHGLEAMAYSRETLDDEIQAYLAGYAEDEFVQYFPEVTVAEALPYVERIKTVFDKFYAKV